MNLHGSNLISQPTQKSARALTATALIIILAKHYGVLPADLTLVGVTISQTAVAGGMFWVVGFLTINHIVHWLGDFLSILTWNSKERVNGVARIEAGSYILTKLDATIEKIDVFLNERIKYPNQEDIHPDKTAHRLESIQDQIGELRSSIIMYRSFGSFYFFGWYLVLPIVVAIASITWPGSTEIWPAP